MIGGLGQGALVGPGRSQGDPLGVLRLDLGQHRPDVVLEGRLLGLQRVCVCARGKRLDSLLALPRASPMGESRVCLWRALTWSSSGSSIFLMYRSCARRMRAFLASTSCWGIRRRASFTSGSPCGQQRMGGR